MDTHILDNPVWYTVEKNHAHFVRGTALAKRYDPDVALGGAVAEVSEAAFAEFAQLVDKGEHVALFQAHFPTEVAGWTIHERVRVLQMVCDQPVPQPQNTAHVLELTAADVPDMLGLVELTKPGPFFPRTIEMGRYIGIRERGQLISMAGERLYPPGYREISAVCTHPDHQGKGYARLLTSLLVNDNWQRGNTPFLHVFPTNERALGLYESLHFHRRCEMQIVFISY